jgi:predicted TPR repeat methyltransferase
MIELKKQLQASIQLHQQGQWQAAEDGYLAVINHYPDCSDAMNLLAILYAQQQQYAQAIPWLEKALQQEPHEIVSLHHLAICLQHVGDTDKALQYIQQALALAPEHAEIYNTLGNVYQAQQQLEQAKNQYKTAINLQPDYTDAYLNLGTIYLKQQDFAEARYCFNQILTINPQHTAAHFQLGNLDYQQGALAEAIAHYQQIPHSTDALLNLGAALLQTDQLAAAIVAFQQILAIEPAHMLAHSNLGAIYLNQREHEKAVNHYYQVITQQPDNMTVHFNLGVLFMRLRKWETAMYHFHRVTQLDEHNADAHVNFATCLVKLQRTDEAIEHYRIALHLRPDDEIAQYRLATLTQEQAPSTAPASYIAALFDNYAENFDHELMDSLQYKVPQTLYKTLSPYLGDRWDLRVVDLGCGTGLCGRYFMPRTQYLAGVDLSTEMLKLADKKHIYDQLIHADIVTALSQWQAELDVITAADVLVYMGDLASVFAACYQALTTDGWLAFTTENTLVENYELTTTGRYAHNQAYLQQQAALHGFEAVVLTNIKLREQQGEPVYGWLGLFKKTTQHAQES